MGGLLCRGNFGRPCDTRKKASEDLRGLVYSPYSELICNRRRVQIWSLAAAIAIVCITLNRWFR
jgi:hypothetical protein